MDPTYFRDMYRGSDDPWGFTTRWYEERKRALTIAALPRAHYARAVEVGSAIGVLSEQLADRCDQLLCIEIDFHAAELARGRLRSLADRIRVDERDFFTDPPAETFDLIVYSEVLYYASPEQLGAVLDWTHGHLEEGGSVIAVHWRADVPEYPQTAEMVHTALAESMSEAATYADVDFLLGVYTYPGTPSVAALEGIN